MNSRICRLHRVVSVLTLGLLCHRPMRVNELDQTGPEFPVSAFAHHRRPGLLAPVSYFWVMVPSTKVVSSLEVPHPGTGLLGTDPLPETKTSPSRANTSPSGFKSVLTPGGTSATTTADRYLYAPHPTVAAVSPRSGPAVGGRVVTVIGTGFTRVTAVRFGTATGSHLRVASRTRLTVITPRHLAGAVDVRVLTPGGVSTAVPKDRYTFLRG